MQILIDGNDSGLTAQTVPEALERGMNAVDSAGRIVVEIALDGTPLDAEQLENGAYETISAETVAMVSLAPNELLHDKWPVNAAAFAPRSQRPKERGRASTAPDHKEADGSPLPAFLP